MSLLRSMVVGVVLSVLGVSLAQATVLTFDSLPTNDLMPKSTDGYDITHSNTEGRVYVSSGGSTFCSPSCVDNGTNHLMGYLNGTFAISASDGSEFDFFGFDGGESHSGVPSIWSTHILLTGTRANGSTASELFALDFINDGSGPAGDFQSFSPLASFTNLVSLNFQGIGAAAWNSFTADNIIVSASSQSVPEPASIALMGLGLAGLGFTRRKKVA